MTGPFSTPRVITETDTPVMFMEGGAPLYIEVVMVSTAVDARSTGATHKLQGGLCVAEVDASGKYVEYVAGGSGGVETCKGFLVTPVNMKEPDGTARDQNVVIVIAGQPMIHEAQVGGLDGAGETDLANKFLFDSDF